MYYNTNNETGDVLRSSIESSNKQEEVIMAIFNHYKKNLSPDEIQGILVDNLETTYPITSIRRAMTNLTNDGKLKKTNIMRKGVWGKMTHTWKLI